MQTHASSEAFVQCKKASFLETHAHTQILTVFAHNPLQQSTVEFWIYPTVMPPAFAGWI